jgi:hypothetical protein
VALQHVSIQVFWFLLSVTPVNTVLATWIKTAVLHMSLHGYVNFIINELASHHVFKEVDTFS